MDTTKNNQNGATNSDVLYESPIKYLDEASPVILEENYGYKFYDIFMLTVNFD